MNVLSFFPNKSTEKQNETVDRPRSEQSPDTGKRETYK